MKHASTAVVLDINLERTIRATLGRWMSFTEIDGVKYAREHIKPEFQELLAAVPMDQLKQTLDCGYTPAHLDYLKQSFSPESSLAADKAIEVALGYELVHKQMRALIEPWEHKYRARFGFGFSEAEPLRKSEYSYEAHTFNLLRCLDEKDHEFADVKAISFLYLLEQAHVDIMGSLVKRRQISRPFLDNFLIDGAALVSHPAQISGALKHTVEHYMANSSRYLHGTPNGG